MLKAQILAELIKQNPTLDKKFLGTIAEKLSVKVTEEAKIEGAVSELANGMISITELAAEFAKEGDRRATDAVNTHKAKYPTPADPKPITEPIIPVIADEATAKMIKEMNDRITKFEAKEKQQSTMSTLLSKMKEHKLPEFLADNLAIADDTDLDVLVTGIKTKWDAYKQSETTENLKSNLFIPGGGAGGAGASTKIDDAMKNFAQAENKKATTPKTL